MQTAEGVVLRMSVAGAGSRFAAGLVDMLILITIIILVTVGFALTGFEGDGITGFVGAFLITGLYLFVILYHVLFHRFWSGRTPGKAAFNLQVLSADGHPPTMSQLLLRGLVQVVDLFVLLVGVFSIAVTEKRQRLGDLAAGTLVARTEVPERSPEPWARQSWSELEKHELPLTPGMIARLDAQDIGFLRAVISRKGLDNQARRKLYSKVARHYMARLGVTGRTDSRTALKEIYLFMREQRGKHIS